MKKYGVFLFFVVVAVFGRLVPHPANFSPIVALALFAGAMKLDKSITFAMVLVSLLISDFFLGFYPGMIFVYGAFAVILLMSHLMNWSKSWRELTVATIGSSVIFFLISNFGVWYTGGLYAKTMDGFVQCYVMALPFFHRSLVGDLFYMGVLFGGYKLLSQNTNFVLSEKRISK